MSRGNDKPTGILARGRAPWAIPRPRPPYEVNYDVNATEDGHEVVFRRIYMQWVDRSDMHPGTVTELEGGQEVDDAELTGPGEAYDIYIGFRPIGRTVYRVTGGSVMQVSGWPSLVSVAKRGQRG